MAFRCENCNKGIMYGHNVSHSKRRTARIFRPNLQKKKIVIGGVTRQVKLCTNCIKLMRKTAEKALAVQATSAESTV